MSTLFEIARNALAVVGLLIVAPIGVGVAVFTCQDVASWLSGHQQRWRVERDALHQVRQEIAAMERGETT